MLLVNKSKRLITINGAIDTDIGAYKSYQLRPGENPEPVEVPDELVKGDDVVKGWLKTGDLLVVVQEPDTVEPDMAELRAEADALGIEVSKRWSRDTLLARIAEKRGEQ